MNPKRNMPGRYGAVFVLTAFLSASATAFAQSDDGDEGALPELSELKPTEIGVRLTPRMADAMSKQFLRQMKPRYELDDEQAENIQKVIRARLMGFAGDNAEIGRDLVEHLMASMIENEGSFTKQDAVHFSELMAPLLPKLKEFFTTTAADVGKHMSLKQRLKLTGDMAGVTAGLALFEGRMKKWQKGEVGDNANPFFDRSDAEPATTQPEPEDPDEHPEHRRARRQVERWIDWQINVDRNWENYVKHAVEYYALNESQSEAARSILKECQEQAQTIKTPEWRKSLMENRIAQQMSYRFGAEASQGPWMFQLEAEYEKLRQPMTNLDTEFKRRIDALPDSTQRAKAEASIRSKLDEHGAKVPA